MSDRARRLAVLAVSPIADVGGAEVLLMDVLRGLKEAGGRSGLVTLGDGPLVDLARLHRLQVFPGPVVSFRDPRSVMRSALHIRRGVQSFRPDIMHASHPRAGLLSRLALPGVPTLHTTQLLEPPSRNDLVGRLCLRLGGTHFALTSDMAVAHAEHNPRLNPVVIEPGVDMQQLLKRAQVGDSERCWSAADLSPSIGPRIVMVARLQPFKGPFDFIAMASRVLKPRRDARFLIIGPDSSRSPGMRDALEAEIHTRGLRDRVALSGPLSADDLAATVRHSTILVHPAHSEGFGLVLVEALALGTPVVAYSASGPRLILARGGGRLVPVGDVEGLATSVLETINDPVLLDDLQKQSSTVAQRFSMEGTIAQYSSALKTVAGISAREHPSAGGAS